MVFSHRALVMKLWGKIISIEYARVNDIPFLGICLGMQMAVIEYARNVIGLKNVILLKWIITKHPVISLMEDQVMLKKRWYNEIRFVEM